MKTPFQAKIFKETFCSQLHTFTLEMQRRSLHFFSFLKRSCKDSDKKDTFWIWSSLLGTALLANHTRFYRELVLFVLSYSMKYF